MMKKIVLIFVSLIFVLSAKAQGPYDQVLAEIEKNSTTLKALSELMEAQKLENRTGIYITNPEIEFNYLWGDPSSIGNRTDFSVKQAFDFPSAYGYRKKIANLENVNAQLMYKAERMNLLLTAKEICIRLTYYNALSKEFAFRLKSAREIADSYSKRMKVGDVGIIEYNKAMINLTSTENEVAKIDLERNVLNSELKALNGGKEIAFDISVFSPAVISPDFEEWYLLAESKNPLLQYVRGEVTVNEERLRLSRVVGLPKLSAGYMMEKVVGQSFKGITLGVSIPLWENKNSVKHAQARVIASRTNEEDARIKFYNNLNSLFNSAVSLKALALSYRNSLENHSNQSLLKKALESGEISFITYLLELQYYYDAFDKLLVTERDLELTMAKLTLIDLVKD